MISSRGVWTELWQEARNITDLQVDVCLKNVQNCFIFNPVKTGNCDFGSNDVAGKLPIQFFYIKNKQVINMNYQMRINCFNR